ncbi:histidine--tRNA ligase [Candidatus Bathyarchaeota archaeon]|nr:histidine--tRNA ligase [Candidatus Bathyarchaeota archaeon]
MPVFKTVRGMRDFLPEEAKMMRYIQEKARKTAELYGYEEIITPVVESYELLAAKTGEEVRKRMYAFKDLGGRMVALRPEFTASVARVVATTLRNEPKPLRLFCVGSLYRYDEPQQGRFREFWQSNFELVGSNNPEADAEIISLTRTFINLVGLKNCVFKVGHVGILRGIFNQEGLAEDLQNKVMQFMDKREYETAFRILENSEASAKCLSTVKSLVKVKSDKTSNVLNKIEKNVEDYHAALNSVENLREIIQLILESEKGIKLVVEAGFARGLEYYTGMIFEVYVPELTIALCGGGRYDKLIELFGGEPTPAVGVAHGIDRIMLAMQKQKTKLEGEEKKRVMVIPLKEELKKEALKLSQLLRDVGMSVEVEVMGRKLARALEDADRRGLTYAVIIGERELKNGMVVVRNLKERKQKTVKIEALTETLKN